MREAIAVAHQSRASNDVPVGALIVDPSGKVIATGTNEREAKSDPTAHAEIVALRKAATHGWRLDNHTLVVTLEPCAMCAGAIAQARISKVIFGAWDEKAGAAGSVWDVLRDPRAIHRVEVESGVLQEECAALLSDFFRSGQ
ncbi:MAG: nucleoside deaminase [Actinobacteria bacterium]|nr:nucleoside deaminase [Actinomycetota bacterium]